MRVLFVSSLWPPAVWGGAEVYAARLAAHLAEAGHETGAVTFGVEAEGVVAIAPAWPYRLDQFEGRHVWSRYAFHARDQYNLSAARAVARAIRDFKPDVVHSHAVSGMSMAALGVPHRLGVGHVHTMHDYWLLCQRTSLQRADQTICDERCGRCRLISAGRLALARRSFADVMIAVSAAVADEHRKAGFLPERIRVVHNPVDVPASVAPRPPLHTPVRIGYLGALTPNKGISVLLRAMQTLGPSAHLVAAGRGRLELAVKDAPNTTYLGWIDDRGREQFFADIDCLVVPSVWKEPAPLVINEAAARGVPVIGAAIGGIPEIVPPGSVPLLFPAGDAAALVDRVRRFVADPGAFASKPAGDALGWEAHVDTIAEAYEAATRLAAISIH